MSIKVLYFIAYFQQKEFLKKQMQQSGILFYMNLDFKIKAKLSVYKAQVRIL